MSEIFPGIWRNAPVRVWPLLAGLVFIGLNAMRTRRSSAIPCLLLPLPGLLAANSISGLVHVPGNWPGFASGYLAGAALAFTLIFVAVIGASSGSVAGRALRVITPGNRP